MRPAVVQRGFTLVEVAIAVVILGLLLSGAVMTLSAQMDLKQIRETQATLTAARDALLGFAAAHGRLPCPAAAGATGVENVVGANCAIPNGTNGLFPGITLGIAPTDTDGYLLDAWGRRIRYVVIDWDPNPAPPLVPIFTSNGLGGVDQFADYVSAQGAFPDWDNMPAPGPDHPGLEVCSVLASGNCSDTSSNFVARDLVVFLYSEGRDGADQSSTTDAREFLNTGMNANFDDIALWISSYTLYERMLSAGSL